MRRKPVELQTGHEGSSKEELESLVLALEKESHQRKLVIDDLRNKITQLNLELKSLSESQSLSSFSGLFNLRIVQEDPELRGMILQIIRTHLQPFVK